MSQQSESGDKIIRVDSKVNPEKEEFITQVLGELGIGKEGPSLPEILYNMAKKTAELCYEVKQIKERG